MRPSQKLDAGVALVVSTLFVAAAVTSAVIIGGWTWLTALAGLPFLAAAVYALGAGRGLFSGSAGGA